MAYTTLQDGTIDIVFDNGFKLDDDISTILINRMFYITRPDENNLQTGYSGNLIYALNNIKPVGSVLMQLISSNKTSENLLNLIENEVILILNDMSNLIDSYDQNITRTSTKINIDINLYIDTKRYNSNFVINTKDNTWLKK